MFKRLESLTNVHSTGPWTTKQVFDGTSLTDATMDLIATITLDYARSTDARISTKQHTITARFLPGN
jgi:hypothetical protein